MCDNHDEIPVKDVTEAHRTKSLVMEKERGIRRDEIHDRMLQLADENVFLKKHARRFEEKAKHLEAKLNRILSEKKFVTRKDEIDAEESKHRIIELEYQVGMLKDRLQVAKQQLASYTQLFPVHAKQKPKSTKAQGCNSTTTTATGGAESAVPNSELAEQFEVILLEAKTENQALEHQVKNLRDQILSLERELRTAKELLQIKEIAYEDELHMLRAQISETDQTKRKLADNIQLIRVQRDSRRACSWVSTLETQCKALEASLSSAQDNSQQLEAQLNAAQEQLRECQQQNLNLQKQVEDSLAEISRVKELEAQISSLQEENAILKGSNESLQAKLAAAGDKVREVETEGTSLKTRISSMELTLKKEIQSKTDLYSEVSREKSRTQTLNETLQELQKKFSAMELELKRMEEKASLASINSNSSEVLRQPPAKEVSSEVIVATSNNVLPSPSVQKSQTPVETETATNDKPGSPCQYCQTLEKDLADTRTTMDKLHDDLIKTKNLLKSQMSTNRECHREIEALSVKLEKADKFHHEKLQQFMEVLEERAKQMQALEESLETIKSQSRLNIAFTDAEAQVEESEPPHPSKNGDSGGFTEQPEPPPQPLVTTESSVIFETHSPLPSPETKPSLEIFLDKFIPNEDSKELTAVNLFATWELNEATKYTPIVSGGIFNSSSTHLLSCETLKVPLPIHIHQAIGESDCKAIGHGSLHPQATTCIVKSVDESQKKIGDLQYKLKVQGLHLTTEPKPAADINSEKTDSISRDTGQSVTQVEGFPKPKPRRLPSQAEMEAYSSLTETSEKEDHGSKKPGSGKAKRKKADAVKYIKKYLSPKREKSVSFEKSPSPKKPILRRDSSSPEVRKKLVKRVTVTEVVEERRIHSSDEDKSEKVSSVSEKTLVVSESSSEASRDEDQFKSSIEGAGAPKIIAVRQALVTPLTVNAETTTTATEQEQSSGSGDETSSIRRASISKARKKRSRKSGGSSASSLELSENDSSSQDSQTYKQTVRIEIAYIVFNSPSRIWGDPNVKKIFIEYRFLDFDPEELETPNSIQKPQPGKKGEFNFVKVFQIDTKERRRLLQTMLEEKKRIRFTLVSEPGENDTLDCEDLGYAYVPMVSLLKEDLVQELIPVYDAENPRSEMGSICVSIQARQALNSL